MGLVAAKCTECGAAIEVDAGKEAGICPHCGTAFITEKVINNVNITNNVTNNIQTAIFKNGDDVEDYVRKVNAFIKAEKWYDARQLTDEMLKKHPDNAITYLCKVRSDIYNARSTDFNPAFEDKLKLIGRSLTESYLVGAFSQERVKQLEELEATADDVYLGANSNLYNYKLDEFIVPFNHDEVQKNLALAKDFVTEAQQAEYDTILEQINKELDYIARYNQQVFRINELKTKRRKKHKLKKILRWGISAGIAAVILAIGVVVIVLVV